MSIHWLFLLINLVRPSIHFSVKVGLSNFWERRSWSLCWYMCNCWLLWSSRCQCWRWNDWRPIFYAPRTHSGFFCSMFFWHSFRFSSNSFFPQAIKLLSQYTLLLCSAVLPCWLGCIRDSNISYENSNKSCLWEIWKWSSQGASMWIF